MLYPISCICWNIDHMMQVFLSEDCYSFLQIFSTLRGLPSSFKGAHGKIHYRLLGKLSRSLRAASKAEAKFNFVARADYDQSTLMVWLMTTILMVKNPKYRKMSLCNGEINMNRLASNCYFMDSNYLTSPKTFILCRHLNMAVKTRMLYFLLLEIFQWIFSCQRQATSKVTQTI